MRRRLALPLLSCLLIAAPAAPAASAAKPGAKPKPVPKPKPKPVPKPKPKPVPKPRPKPVPKPKPKPKPKPVPKPKSKKQLPKQGASATCPSEPERVTLGKRGGKLLKFTYRHDGDGCGVVAWIGTDRGRRPFRNPAEDGEITARASSVAHDSEPPSSLLGRALVRFTTKPQPESWVELDLGRHRVAPTHYTLRHYSSWDTEALRNWELRGSNDGIRWTTLRRHEDDTSLQKKGQRETWEVTGKAAQRRYRFFRVVQTGKNSNMHHYLALSGFEVYGLLETRAQEPAPAFAFAHDFDQNGVMYHLGTAGGQQAFKNPVTRGRVTVTSSSVMQDSEPPRALLDRRTLRFSTKPQANSWVQFALDGQRVRPTRYTLRHYSSWDTEALRNWVLEGSNDGVSWVTLREHKGDAALNKKGATHTWTLPTPKGEGYQLFRVRQTGRNSNNHYYLALSGFELYGDLLPGQPLAGRVYSHDFDQNGVMYHLGTDGGQAFKNPVTRGRVAVTASSVMQDSEPPRALLDRRTLRFSTKPQANSWVQFELKGQRLRATRYTLRHYSSWDTEALRDWVLEGSNDGQQWATLREHKGDAALNKKGATHTWALSGPASEQSYRLFRVRQTGRNSNNHHYLALSGFEIYGALEPAAD